MLIRRHTFTLEIEQTTLRVEQTFASPEASPTATHTTSPSREDLPPDDAIPYASVAPPSTTEDHSSLPSPERNDTPAI